MLKIMKGFVSLLEVLWAIVKYPLYGIGILLGAFLLALAIAVIVELIKGKRFKKGQHVQVKKIGFFKRLFVMAPRQFALDMFAKDPEFFRYQGCIVFTGRQGAGKTIAMVEQTLRFQKEYPKCKVISNCGYKYQDDELDHWEKLLDYKNGIQGVVVQMDEMQNWFSSNQSKNFPPEMLEVICQNRKNRRIILGTSQVFIRLGKPLREQATEVRKCTTLFGVITIVHCVRPELDSQGDVTKWKHIRFYFFVHTPEIREAYDTYRVVESLSKSGFQERPSEAVVNVYTSK